MPRQFATFSLHHYILVLAILSIALGLLLAPQRWEMDSLTVAQGAADLHEYFVGRKAVPLDLGAFAPFQYLTGLIAVVANKFGIPLPIFGLWIALNMASLAVVSALFFRAGTRACGNSGVGLVTAVIAVAGPLMAYSTSTFNESIASLVVCCFVALTCRGCNLWAAVFFVLAGLTKEISVPLLLPMWIAAALLPHNRAAKRNRWHLPALMLASSAAVIGSHAAFNWLRFESWRNTAYLTPDLLVSNWSWRLEYAAALWFSPNGGGLFFWPMLTITMMFCIARGLADRQTRASSLSVLFGLLILTFGLASWAVPFGWWCWGPRLMVPWLAGFFMLAVQIAPPTDALRALAARPALWCIITIFVCIASLPHFAQMYDLAAVADFFAESRRAPTAVESAEQMHAKVSRLAWRHTPFQLLIPLRSLLDPKVAALAALHVFGLVLLLLEARRRCRRGVG